MLLGAFSCAKIAEETVVPAIVEEPSVTAEGINIVVNASIPDDSADTKVSISQIDETHYQMNWSASGETATLIESRQKDWQILPYNSTSAVLTGGSMAFSFEAITPQAPQDWASGKGFGYDIIYPGTAYDSKSGMTATLSLPATQTPQAASPDAAASLLYGRAGVFETQPATDLNAEFSHLAAYCRMTLIGIPAGESITSIAITAADYNIAGNLIYNTWSRAVAYTGSEEHTITLNGTNLTADPDGFDVWFACKPFTLEAGHTLSVVTTTSESVYPATLKAKYDLAFEAGVVTSFPTVNKCVVTFESNGGTVVAPAVVKKGQKISEPSAPTKAVDLVQGLYSGVIDPNACYATFAGWYTDPECTVAYDFNTAVTSSFILYAKWTDVPEPINPSDIKWINQGFTYATSNAGTYTFVLTSDASSGSVLLLNNAASTIIVAGKGAERIVSSTVNWQAAIRAQSGTVILANNTTVTNTAGPAAMLADGGNIIMRTGSKVKNCTVSPTSSYGDVRGVVYINNASSTFTLDGGEITGNTMTGVNNDYLAATVCANNGNIVINSGSITNNTVTRTSGPASVGGAISLPYRNDGAVLRKTGGVISGNAVVDDSKVNNRIGQQVMAYTISGTRHYYTIDGAIGEEVTFDAINFSSPIWTLVEPH